jgi:cytochrome c oxidase cbb3-type subunit 2
VTAFLPFFNRGRIARRSFAIIVLAVFGVLLTHSARTQSSAHRTSRSVYAVLGDAPEKARARKNPFAGDPIAVAAGGKLFAQHCSECHGKNAGGSMRGANLRSDEVRQASAGTIFWILSNGVVRQGMPVWSKLPEPERWQIVTFLQSLPSKFAPPGGADPSP